MSEFLDKAKKIVSQVFHAIAETGKEHSQKKRDYKDFEEMSRKRTLLGMFQMDLQGDYDAFADAVFKCIQSNYQKLGLARPNEIEAVYSETDWQMGSVPHIDGSYNNEIIFRYEADRRISDMYIGGGKKLDCPQVSTENIAQGLYRELPKYSKRRGYGFARLEVIDIANNKVRITVSGVHRIYTPQMPCNFGGVYDD